MTYSQKLKDPRWQKKRLEVLQRDSFKCLACGRDKETLQVHHLRYESDPWDVENQFLETLCGTCHAARTEDDSMRVWMIRTRPTREVISETARELYLQDMQDSI